VISNNLLGIKGNLKVSIAEGEAEGDWGRKGLQSVRIRKNFTSAGKCACSSKTLDIDCGGKRFILRSTAKDKEQRE